MYLKLTWACDIHLDHAHPNAIDAFCNKVLEQNADAILLGGDISNANSICDHLEFLSNYWSDKPIYLTLGNHDYYGSGFYDTWKAVEKCAADNSNLFWLDQEGVVALTDNTALIGSGLWCDWRAGDHKRSTVWLNDYSLIHEFKTISMEPAWLYTEPILKAVQFYAKVHADQLLADLNKAIDAGYKEIVALTHVPPFWEGSFHNGKVQDANWAPHFVCKIAGDMMREVMEQHPEVKLTVYSGHTHGSGEADILPNLHTVNGKARYKRPELQKPIIVD